MSAQTTEPGNVNSQPYWPINGNDALMWLYGEGRVTKNCNENRNRDLRVWNRLGRRKRVA